MSPAKADPFHGQCVIPASAPLTSGRAWLEMDGVTPETAARVTINETYAGGLLAKPLRLDVTRHLKNGMNKIVIEPFAPSAARIVFE